MFSDKPVREMSTFERREYLWMLRLRSLPQFRQIVWKLAHGESTMRVAEWFMTQEDRGDLTACNLETVHRYMKSAAARVRREARQVPRLDVSELHRTAVAEQVNSRLQAVVAKVRTPLDWDEVEQLVTQAVKTTDASTALKYCFVIQQARVKKVREMEDKLKMTLPHGNKAVEVLKEIAAEIRKVELGEAYLQRNSGQQWGSPFPGGLVPHESELIPEIETVARMPEVEKNLTREAAKRVIDLIQQEAKSGPYSKSDADKDVP